MIPEPTHESPREADGVGPEDYRLISRPGVLEGAEAGKPVDEIYFVAVAP
jgi:hypothetical protein